MRFSENLNLPILQDGDKYSKEIQNEAFNTIDRECTNIKNTIKSALDISEDVSNAIKTLGDISEELSDLKEKQNEDYYELLESNNYIGNKIRDINSQLEHKANKDELLIALYGDFLASKNGFVNGEDISNKLVEYFSTKDIIVIDNSTYKISKTIDITGKTIIGVNGIIDGTINTYLRNPLKITGLQLSKTGIEFQYNSSINSIIENNKFSNCNIAIYCSAGNASCPSNKIIKNNYFDSCVYGLKGGLIDSFICKNTFRNSPSRNIEINHGRGNRIYDNDIIGGVTGICFLYDSQLTRRIIPQENFIYNNKVKDITEEGISLDCYGSNSDKCNSMHKATILQNTTGNRFKIDNEFSASMYNGSYAIITKGDKIGQTYRIETSISDGTATSGKHNVIQLAIVNDKPSLNDEIVISLPFIQNSITGNTVENCGRDGIILYGNSIGTIVSNNTCINSSIKICKLNGITKGLQAPCNFNIISNNKINGSFLIYEDFIYGYDNGYRPLKGVNNSLINNTIFNGGIKILTTDVEPSYIKNNNNLINSYELITTHYRGEKVNFNSGGAKVGYIKDFKNLSSVIVTDGNTDYTVLLSSITTV